MTFSNACGKKILERMVKAIQDNKDYLGEIDGLVADGDHGMNMNKGFTLFANRYADAEYSFSEGLQSLAMILMEEIGGSMGPIYGTIFSEMSDYADEAEDITMEVLAGMLNAGIVGLYDIVDARKGDKTLVDTLVPAYEALSAALQAGKSFEEGINDMQEAAVAGKDSTKDMVAKYGRSSRLGERSKGVIDAGAASCCILICAMAEGIKELLE